MKLVAKSVLNQKNMVGKSVQRLDKMVAKSVLNLKFLVEKSVNKQVLN